MISLTLSRSFISLGCCFLAVPVVTTDLEKVLELVDELQLVDGAGVGGS